MADNTTESGFNVEYNRPKLGLSSEEPDLTRVSDYTPSPQLEQGNSEFYQARPFSDQQGERIAGEFIPYREEHEPYGLQPDGDKVVCISKAHLYEIHPVISSGEGGDGGSIKKYDLTPLSIAVQAECVVYAQFKTDDHGHVKAGEEAKGDKKATSAYTLLVAENLPESTDYTIPDGSGNSGADGEYNIPICYIENFKFKLHQFDSEQDGREAQVRGTQQGHRGPLIWAAGYHAIRNVGVGAAVYRDYTEIDDFKNFRRINEKTQDRNCEGNNNISGLAQIKVEEDGDNINVFGNRFNATWKVGARKQAIIEDGLVRCITDIQSQELETVSVLSSATTTGGDATVLVARCPSESQKAKAWGGGATNAKMIEGIPHNKMWSGGTEKTIDYVKICVSSSSTTGGTSEICYWVLGEVATNNVAPASVTYVDSPISCVGVTSAVQITGIANSTTDSNLSTLVQDDSITDLLCVTIASSATTVEVYKASGNLTVLKESTGDGCDTCPTE